MRIYEIADAIENCMALYENGVREAIDGETGEIKPLADYIEELKLEKDEKIRRLALYCKEQKMLIDSIKEEKKRITDRQAREEKRLQSAMDYLQLVLEGAKVKDPQFTVSYRKSEAVEIAEGAVIPKEYLVEQEPKVSKTELKNALKKGLVIDGVSLVERVNMSVK